MIQHLGGLQAESVAHRDPKSKGYILMEVDASKGAWGPGILLKELLLGDPKTKGVVVFLYVCVSGG